MKAKAKAKAVAKCYYCSGVVLESDNYTALLQKQKGHEVMAVAHSEWTGCQKAINNPELWSYPFRWAEDNTAEELLTSSI